MAEELLLEKPHDLHTKRSKMLGISRDDAKGVNYGVLYGAQAAKVAKMLKVPMDKAQEIFQGFWDSSPPLKELKTNLEKHWEANDKKYILGIDGRRLFARSQHSLVNLLFQGAGSIAVKYTTVLIAQRLEELGLLGNIFEDSLEESLEKIYQMIIYHK